MVITVHANLLRIYSSMIAIIFPEIAFPAVRLPRGCHSLERCCCCRSIPFSLFCFSRVFLCVSNVCDDPIVNTPALNTISTLLVSSMLSPLVTEVLIYFHCHELYATLGTLAARKREAPNIGDDAGGLYRIPTSHHGWTKEKNGHLTQYPYWKYSINNNNNNNIIAIAPWFQVTLFKGAVAKQKNCENASLKVKQL